MLIGKPLTALGGGGLKPEIIVTAKAGALLNLYYKDSTIILQSYQLGASETTHTFVVSVSETSYVVEDATNGESVEVLVDAVAQYSVEIYYKLWLYRDGDECEGVTGGWGQVNYWGSSASLHKNTDNINVYCPSGNYSCAAVTVNKVDLTQYSKLTINVLESVVNGTGWNSLIILSNRNTPDTDSNRAGVINIYGRTGELSTDISSITGSWYVGVYVNSHNKGECHIKFDKVWLE